ncbi:hypothetical protein V2J09_010569 [Rumex salicifolius]
MEAGGTRAKHFLHIFHGVLPSLSAALFISMGYIHPGKWAACIDSGAQFGVDLAVFLFLFNLLACMCQYLSVHINLVCNKNLAQGNRGYTLTITYLYTSSFSYSKKICYIEYHKVNRIFLGIQAEVSIIMSDLAMVVLHFFLLFLSGLLTSTISSLYFSFCLVLGIANGLHMILRVNLFTAVILAALDVVLYPLFSILLEKPKANGLLVRLAVVTLVGYVLVMLIGLSEDSVSPISVPPKLVGENFYAIMSLLGANVIPHNFYLHSSLVQRFRCSSGETKNRVAYYNFYSILALFIGIFFVNYMLMNSAADVLHSFGVVPYTFEDAIHISGLSWDICGEGRQTILYDFFRIDLPCWLHRAVVRIFVIFPALYSLWNIGAEGMYQMLMSTHIMVALLLPPSVVSLCKIAFSRALMGANAVSPAMEFFMITSSMAMIGLQSMFLGDMMFGDSAWLGYLRWDKDTASILCPKSILLFGGFASLFLTYRLFVTPLRTEDRRLISQQWRRQRYVDAFWNERRARMMNARSDSPAPNHFADLHGSVPVPEDLVTRTVIVVGEPETKNGEEASQEASHVAQALETNDRNNGYVLDERGNGDGRVPSRSARLQVAAILNEFWEQLYDYYGQFTQEAKAKKLDLSFGNDIGSRTDPPRFDVFQQRSLFDLDSGSFWANRPYDQFDVSKNKYLDMAMSANSEVKLLRSLRLCILMHIKVNGSDWLFRQTDAVDEDLVNRLADKERFLCKAMLNDNVEHMDFSVPHCGNSCVWNADLIVSFGVWCIHRILELSLRERNPELWGKYTYVLNRLQGVIDMAFSEKRRPKVPCICLQIEPGKVTTAGTLCDIVKDTETFITTRVGNRCSLAANVAFTMGKGNLVSVLQRYKRRLAQDIL